LYCLILFFQSMVMHKLNVICFALPFIFSTHFISAQDASLISMREESSKIEKKLVVDTGSRRWGKGVMYSLNFSQASLSNWSAGGDKFSLSVNSILNTYANYKKGRNSWDNSFEFLFGYVNSTSLGSRKNDDRFDFVSKYGYSLNKRLNIASLFNLRSQFFKGYTYDGVSRILHPISCRLATSYKALGLITSRIPLYLYMDRL